MVMRKMLLVVAVLCSGQEMLTLGIPNGRVWKQLKHSERIEYVEALDEGVNLALAELDKCEDHQKVVDGFARAGFTNEDRVAVMDAVYKDRENIRIPISAVFQFSLKKLSGQFTKEELEETLVKVRTFVANAR